MQKPEYQAGHIVLEGLLALAVVVLAGGAILTYQSHMRTQNAAATTAAVLTASAKASAANKVQSQAALTQVKTFYKAYLPDPTGSAASWQQQGFITAAAVTATTGKTYDLFACSQNPLAYSKYTFTNPVVNGATATMSVGAVYAGPPAKTTIIKLGLKKNGTVWQINAVACPGLK